MVEILHNGVLLHISFQFHIQGCHIGNLESTMGVIFTSQIHQMLHIRSFGFSPLEPVKHLPAHPWLYISTRGKKGTVCNQPVF